MVKKYASRLTIEQATRLTQWLINNKDEFKIMRVIEVTRMAEKALGFPIHEDRVAKTCKELGVEIGDDLPASRDAILNKLQHNQRLLIQSVLGIMLALDLNAECETLKASLKE